MSLASTIRWRAWCDEAFREAAAEQKPILLSLVTAWSEECSAMDASVYTDAGVAGLVCERFVPIRVDSDARPDINDRYNMGGWPSTALLTPDGELLNGGTYFGPAEMVGFLRHAADAWRDRAPEIVSRARREPATVSDRTERARAIRGDDASAWFRGVMLDQFDPQHGGFGRGPKFPHVPVMLVALSLADEDADRVIREIAEVSLDRMSALWDVANGGFFRYADAPDWSHPATEKTLEDHAALLNLFVDAAIRFGSDEYRDRAGEIARWMTSTLAEQPNGGFFNSQAALSRTIDRSMFVDRNASTIGALLRAAMVFDDPWLRDFALRSLETVIVPGYVPGRGVAHQYIPVGTDRPGLRTDKLRGFLGDQILTASALIWAHRLTGQLPYSMLALELVQFAVRTMWDEAEGCFRDVAEDDTPARGLLVRPAYPFALNCEAACVLDRLAVLTGDTSHRDRAHSILSCFEPEFRGQGLFAAPYVLAVREVVRQSRPPGLELSHVDWDLEHG